MRFTLNLASALLFSAHRRWVRRRSLRQGSSSRSWSTLTIPYHDSSSPGPSIAHSPCRPGPTRAEGQCERGPAGPTTSWGAMHAPVRRRGCRPGRGVHHVGSPRATDSGRDPRARRRARARRRRDRDADRWRARPPPPPPRRASHHATTSYTHSAPRAERARSAASPPPNAMPIDAAGCARARRHCDHGARDVTATQPNPSPMHR